LVELRECNAKILDNLKEVQEILTNVARVADATIVESVFDEFSRFGISGMVVIAESHLSIHTWPEYSYTAVDIFTCNISLKSEKAVKYLAEKLQCRNSSIVEVKQGIMSPENKKLPHKAGAKTFCDSLGADSGGLQQDVYSTSQKF
jgi:S-adenosylmethionine decarboxylase